MNMNPICKYDGKWWFWNEIWTERLGGYDSKEEAERELDKYCEFLDKEVLDV